jgi:8-oxo-dGTP pyrophosphatase MutT (NUDIX family)
MTARRADVLSALSALLTRDEPIERVPAETAAVAVIIGVTDLAAELLLIRRSERRGDPWSGHVALPGGRVEEGDGSFRETAVRETREEVDIDLERSARFVGYTKPYQARMRGIWVVPCVFLLSSVPVVTPNQEVASYAWMPLDEILAPESRTTYRLNREGRVRVLPAFNLRGYLVWGLTERILSSLVEAVQKEGVPGPEQPSGRCP